MSDRYPTEEELVTIKTWTGHWRECFAFIRSIWWMPDWGWRQTAAIEYSGDRPVTRYEMSTGGWSGNEDIVGAMQGNFILWSMYWMQSRRGGHYIFEVPLADVVSDGITAELQQKAIEALEERTP